MNEKDPEPEGGVTIRLVTGDEERDVRDMFEDILGWPSVGEDEVAHRRRLNRCEKGNFVPRLLNTVPPVLKNIPRRVSREVICFDAWDGVQMYAGLVLEQDIVNRFHPRWRSLSDRVDHDGNEWRGNLPVTQWYLHTPAGRGFPDSSVRQSDDATKAVVLRFVGAKSAFLPKFTVSDDGVDGAICPHCYGFVEKPVRTVYDEDDGCEVQHRAWPREMECTHCRGPILCGYRWLMRWPRWDDQRTELILSGA